ncbi:hypothetical protein N9023_04860 [Opitutaceae bacterium]|nr:hypothetical protein [Opitutaceae bacterium]
MKTTIALLSTALIAPATIMVGLAAPVAFGITAVLGLSSIAISDYRDATPSYAKTAVVAKRTEAHPYAA